MALVNFAKFIGTQTPLFYTCPLLLLPGLLLRAKFYQEWIQKTPFSRYFGLKALQILGISLGNRILFSLHVSKSSSFRIIPKIYACRYQQVYIQNLLVGSYMLELMAEIRKIGPICLSVFHFTAPLITRLVPGTSWSHLQSSKIRHFPHFSMKLPRIATVLAKVANSPRCGEFLCGQSPWLLLK